MKKGSITFKLFMITTLCFSLFLCIFMTGQTLFFKSFYLNMKTSRLEKSIEEFSRQYETDSWDSANITRNVNKFAEQNNSQIAILDGEGKAKYTPVFQFVLETSDKNKIKVPLDNIAYLEGFQNLKLSIGSEVEVEGLFTNDSSQVVFLSSVKNGDITWKNTNFQLVTAGLDVKQESIDQKKLVPSSTAISVTPETNDITKSVQNNSFKTLPGPTGAIQAPIVYSMGMQKKIYGKIVDLDIPSEITQITNYNKELLWSSIEYWNGLLVLKKIKVQPEKIISFHYTNPSNGMDNIVMAKPIFKDNKIYEFIFAVSSLQPVGEAVDVMKDYYIYAFIAALILIAIMALFFSRIISKPLIKMNQVAAKMADFDFSEEVIVESDDELGSMAVSLNLLSRNLGTSLRELKNANEQLQLDIEKEKKLEIMRKEFISSVSHELKTPLGIISGYAEGIKDNIAENKKEYYINVILDEVEKMDELVLDLLDLAKLESDAYKLDIEIFNIIDLLIEVERRLTNSVNDKKIKLIREYVLGSVKVYGDLKRIEQVITNILNNAIRYTYYEGIVKIGIVQEKDLICVYIENSGAHIEKEDLVRIWERFYRIEKSRNRKTGGTGLGLSIVKNILERHESSFGVENTEIGVKFYFTLKPV